MLSLHLGAASTKSKQTHSGLEGKPPPHHKTSHVSLDFCRSRFPALQVHLKTEVNGNHQIDLQLCTSATASWELGSTLTTLRKLDHFFTACRT